MGAFNGSGVFVRSYSWTSDAANNIDITASRVDTEDTGFASGLSLCVTRDGQGQMAADFLPSAASTYKLGNASFPWSAITLEPNAAGTFLTGTLSGGATAVLQIAASDPGLILGTTTAHGVGIIVNGIIQWAINATGNITATRPSIGNTLTVNGLSGSNIWPLALNNSVLTGVRTAGFTSTNKPGNNNQTGPSTWIPVVADGQLYWVPGFLP